MTKFFAHTQKLKLPIGPPPLPPLPHLPTCSPTSKDSGMSFLKLCFRRFDDSTKLCVFFRTEDDSKKFIISPKAESISSIPTITNEHFGDCKEGESLSQTQFLDLKTIPSVGSSSDDNDEEQNEQERKNGLEMKKKEKLSGLFWILSHLLQHVF